MTSPNINIENFLANCDDMEAIIEFWNFTKSIKNIEQYEKARITVAIENLKQEISILESML
jgi:hypothetical protein